MFLLSVARQDKIFRNLLLALSISAICFFPRTVFADITEALSQGDFAVQEGNFKNAEEIFTRALKEEPENYRVLFSLAKVKVSLKKLSEADKLLDRILAMKVSNGRDVLVYMNGESAPLEAELVDEIVMPADDGKNNMRNYLDAKKRKSIPHYRLFFKKEGKMKLVPSDQARIKYTGVLRRVYEFAQELKANVKKRLMAAAGSTDKRETVALKGGCFMMGSAAGDADEKPVHKVCVASFKMDKHEVTQSSFQKVMGTNPSLLAGANLPVENVTWDEATGYCKKSGKRLPTEAEWEYAARGGQSAEYYWGSEVDAAKANFCDAHCTRNFQDASKDDGYKTAAPIGSFPPNPFGLYDMAGNVNEWVNDFMLENYYQTSPKQDPQGPSAGETFIIRGGGWNSNAHSIRHANRSSFMRDYRNDGVGFRCVAG